MYGRVHNMELLKPSDFLARLAAAPRQVWRVRELAGLGGMTNDNTMYKWAERWRRRGMLKRGGKGCYSLTWAVPTVYELAAAVYIPSYLSLESALAYHGVLSQAPARVTSVTSRKSCVKMMGGIM